MSYFFSLLLHMFIKKLTEETVVDDNGAPNVGDLEWTIIGPYTLQHGFPKLGSRPKMGRIHFCIGSPNGKEKSVK